MHRSRVSGCSSLKVTGALCKEFGIASRGSKRRALEFWRALGVWELNKDQGKNPEVSIAILPGHVQAVGRLRRVRAGKFEGQTQVTFTCGLIAHATSSKHLKRLRLTAAKSEFVDVVLEDRGTGWIVDQVLEPSEAHGPLEVERAAN